MLSILTRTSEKAATPRKDDRYFHLTKKKKKRKFSSTTCSLFFSPTNLFLSRPILKLARSPASQSLPSAPCSVEPLPAVVLLLLVYHDTDNDADDAPDDAQQQEEEGLHPGHGGGLRVLHVIPRRREVGGGGLDVRAVLGIAAGRDLQLVHLHPDHVVVVGKLP